MNLTLGEFWSLIALYRKGELSEEEMIRRNPTVPMHAIIEAASILEDSSYEQGEKLYLVKSIYEEIVNPTPVPIEVLMFNEKKMKQSSKDERK